MDKLSVQQKSPKEKKAVTHSGSKGKRGKRINGGLDEGHQQKPNMKVVYISNPMRVTTTASEFKDRVQELTGRNADVADIFFNSSSDYNCGSGAGPVVSPSANTSEYYSPCSSSSHEEDPAPSQSATRSATAEPTYPPQVIYKQSELTGHHHLNSWLGDGETDQRRDLPFFGALTDGHHETYYGAHSFDSQMLENSPLPPAANRLQSPPPSRQLESPLADVFRQLADGRHP